VSKSRDWADLSDNPNYEELVVFGELIRAYVMPRLLPLPEVSEETATFLKQKCSKQLDGPDCLTTRNA